jgi:hypothetical protein
MNIPNDVFSIAFDQPMALRWIFPEFSAKPLRHPTAIFRRDELVMGSPQDKEWTTQ